MTTRHGATKIFSMERTVVVGVDGSKQSEDAVEWAAHEAKVRDAVLRVLSVAPQGSDTAPEWIDRDAVQQATAVVDAAVETASDVEPTVTVRGDVVEGHAADMLAAAGEVADLLVVGAGGRGALGEFLLGSVSHRIAHVARCPVVVLRTPAPGAWDLEGRIVVRTDGTEEAEKALLWAYEEAERHAADVDPVHCEGSSPDARGLHDLLTRCEGANLLVVADPGHHAIHDRVVGSLAQHCVHHAPCPVVVLGPAALR